MKVDVAIRGLTEADIVAADEIFRSAFHTSVDRLADLERYVALQPDGWLFATVQGMPVGLVGAVDYGPFAYIGMMAVRPEFQRHGIGHTLMRQLLARLDARGTPMALLDASEAGAPIYMQLGFVQEDLACLFEHPHYTPAQARAEYVHLMQRQDLELVADLDAPIFGAGRASLFRILLADFPERAFVTRDEAGQVSGYLFAQPGRLGPWVAKRRQDAQALLQAAMSLPFEAAPVVIAPQMNAAAIELLERFGFQFKRSCRHMRRGGSNVPSRRDLIYGQTSFAVG